VAAQVKDSGNNSFRVEFSPRTAGEHRIAVAVAREPVPGSPFSCKAYDVKAIKVMAADTGSVGKAVTFLGEYKTKFFKDNFYKLILSLYIKLFLQTWNLVTHLREK